MALDWHTRRQMAPHLFTSQLRNKLRYARYGARQLFQGGAFNSLLQRAVSFLTRVVSSF